MTADPGAYDATPADLALEREDRDEEATVDEWREWTVDDYLTRGEYASAAAARHALDATFAAITPHEYMAAEDGISDAKDWAARGRARIDLADAALALRSAELNGLGTDDDEWR